MQFVMAGMVFSINSLEPDIDKAFFDLHEAFSSNRAYNLADFEKATLAFFDNTVSDASAHDRYFNNFTLIWRSLLNSNRLDQAEQLWAMALQPALAWEKQHQGSFIHKGTPFYFWGMSAILKGDIDRGHALMHQALKEDIRTSGNPSPNTPAFAFATLNYMKVDQAFREWVLQQAEFLNELLKAYCLAYTKKLLLEDFQSRFLSNPPSLDAVFLFTHTLARLSRLDSVPKYALESDFAGQLQINLLFDITLVIDAAIKAKNPNHWQFIDHASFLSKRDSSLGLNKNQLQEINKAFKAFDATLKALIEGTFNLQDGSALSTGGRDLAIAYGLRNHAAHNVSSAPTIRSRFADIRQSLFNILFLCVETLY